jgi:hypothetical protein
MWGISSDDPDAMASGDSSSRVPGGEGLASARTAKEPALTEPGKAVFKQNEEWGECA